MKPLVVGTALLLAQAALAAPPVVVKRANDAGSVASTTPVASMLQGPFDDAPGLLHDGQDYYYLAIDSGGQPLTISLHPHAALDTVRVGFDDADAYSAPVDTAFSTVDVAPPFVPADGVTFATITIEPRDASGVLLGAGLAVSLDAWSLWPGAPVGPVQDLGNGRYRVRVASAVPGTTTVVVDVEGQWLDVRPELVFQPVGELSLKELAILQIDDLSSAGGVLEDLLAGVDPDTHPGDEIVKTLNDALKALTDLQSGDPDKDEKALEDHLHGAISHLLHALEDPAPLDPQDLLNVIDRLLDAARLVGDYWLDQALMACGPCTGVDPQHVCKAEQALAQGDSQREPPAPDYRDAVRDYGKSVEESIKALGNCG